MFLYVTNLPADAKVEQLKQVIKEQCYVENIMLEVIDHGKDGKSIKVGCMDKIEASVILAKLDGYYYHGRKLCVSVDQQKPQQPQPSSTPQPTPVPPMLPSGIVPTTPFPVFPSNAGLPLFPSGLRPPAPPLRPSGVRPSAPPPVRPAPPLTPVAPLKNLVVPPASSMPFYAIQAPTIIKNPLSVKSRPSHGFSSEKSNSHDVSSKRGSDRDKTTKSSRQEANKNFRRSRSRGKSRSPHRRSRVKSHKLRSPSPKRGRNSFDRYNPYNRERHRSPIRGRFKQVRYSPDRKERHLFGRSRLEDSKHRKTDRRERRRSRSKSGERIHQRKRSRNRESGDDDIDRKRYLKSRSSSSDPDNTPKTTESPVEIASKIEGHIATTSEVSVESTISQTIFESVAPYNNIVKSEPTEISLNNDNPCSNVDYAALAVPTPSITGGNIDTYSAALAVPNPSITEGASMPSETYCQTQYAGFPPNFYTNQLSNISTNTKYTNYQFGFVPPQSPNVNSPNSNVPFNPSFQTGFVPPPQNSAHPNPTIRFNPRFRPECFPPPPYMNTPNPNFPMQNANFRPRLFPTSQNRNTFKVDVPISDNIQTEIVPSPPNTIPNNRQRVLWKQWKWPKGPFTLNNVVTFVSKRVVTELMYLYQIKCLPPHSYEKVKAVYSDRIREAIKEVMNLDDAYEYYKKLYPYLNEKLVLEGVLGTKVAIPDKDRLNPDQNILNSSIRGNQEDGPKRNNKTKATLPTPPPKRKFEPYKVKFNGVDRDMIYEAALEKEFNTMEEKLQQSFKDSRAPMANKLCSFLKKKGVNDFLQSFKKHLLKQTYTKWALKITYSSRPCEQKLNEFMRTNDVKMTENKEGKFIIARCRDKENYSKLLSMKFLQIGDEILNIERFNFPLVFYDQLKRNVASPSTENNYIANNVISEEFKECVLNIPREDNKESTGTKCDASDSENVNTVSTEKDQGNATSLETTSARVSECDTSMENYVDLPVEEENKCAEESTSHYDAVLELKNTQCKEEFNEQSNRCDEPVGEHIHTTSDEIDKGNTQDIKEPNNVENKNDTRAKEFVNVSPTTLKSEITQCIEESNTSNSECVKSLVCGVALTDKVEQDSLKCIKESNNAQNTECDTRQEQLNNMPNVKVEVGNAESNTAAEVYVDNEKSHIQQYTESDISTQCVTNEPAKLENISGIGDSHIIQSIESDNHKEESVNVPHAGIESEGTGCIDKISSTHNECTHLEKYTTVSNLDLETESSQRVKEYSKAVDTLLNTESSVLLLNDSHNVEESAQIPNSELESQNTTSLQESKITQSIESDNAEEELVNVLSTESKQEQTKNGCVSPMEESTSTQCTKEFDKPGEELLNTEYTFGKQDNTKCVEESNNTLNERGTSMEEESINKQKTDCDTFIKEYINVRTAKELEDTKSIALSKTQKIDSNYAEDTECGSMDDEIANTLAEIELCLENSDFDFDTLTKYNDVENKDGEQSDMNEKVIVEEKIDELVTEVVDDDLEDF